MRRRHQPWTSAAAARLLVLALVLMPLAFGEAAPTFLRLFAVPDAHVCHCERKGPHVECACPLCDPDRTDLISGDVAIRAACGDEPALGHARPALPAVLPSPFLLVPYSERAPRLDIALATPSSHVVSPPTPPPRSARS